MRPNYLVINRQQKRAIDGAKVRRFISTLVPALVPQLNARAAFSVVFITDEVMRSYNREYRGYDKPTDVLSFRGENGYLGDILISVETAYNQARRSRRLTFQTNVKRLLLHGLLHLMGYDHETDDGEMRRIERRLRRRFGC